MGTLNPDSNSIRVSDEAPVRDILLILGGLAQCQAAFISALPLRKTALF